MRTSARAHFQSYKPLETLGPDTFKLADVVTHCNPAIAEGAALWKCVMALLLERQSALVSEHTITGARELSGPLRGLGAGIQL